MRPDKLLPGPALLLTALTGVSFFPRPVFAQDDQENKSSEDVKTTEEPKTSAPRSSAAPTSEAKTSEAKTTDAPKSSANPSSARPSATSNTEEEETTSAPKSTAKTTSAEEEETTSTPTPTSKSSSSSSRSTRAGAATTEVGLTGLPTLTKSPTIPTYPPPAVPPTKNAPFMQHSSAPDGTVFIAVGAILGAFGLAILLWRAIVGFLLHRSVEKAAKAQHDANQKAGFPAPPAPFYKYTDNASSLSVAAGRGVRRTNRGPVTSSVNPSQSQLFFSPTAVASGNPGNRGSSFLPSGFYAAGNSSPGGHEHSISLTNLRPDSRGHFVNPSRHTLGPTPPDSPAFNARRDISSSSLNLNRPPSQRAPSAFLDDLLADDPGSLPPPGVPPAASQRHSSYGSNSPGPQNRF